MKIDMIIDLQFGSTGKGLIAGHLAEKNGYETVISANMPNAGHTYINNDGRKWIHKVLPNGIVSPRLKQVMIGSGAIFDIERLKMEVYNSDDLLRHKDLVIHESAAILQPRHSDLEREMLNGISSTMQGSAAAMVERILRQTKTNNDILAYRWGEEIREAVGGVMDVHIVNNRDWTNHLHSYPHILAEGAQGYSLGISSGFWPYCTSRDCTPARFMADMMLPIRHRVNVIGTARTYPIRVGNTEGGNSGPCYYDQRETSWAEIGQEEERTTVTNRVRRVFTFSFEQIVEACQVCMPDQIFLNFCNYMDEEKAYYLVDKIEYQTGTPVIWTGWGPKSSDIRMGRGIL